VPIGHAWLVPFLRRPRLRSGLRDGLAAPRKRALACRSN
jgi:hypothetical protein